MMTAPLALGLASCRSDDRRTQAATRVVEPIRSGSRSIPSSLKLTPQTIVVPAGTRAIAGFDADRKALRLRGIDDVKAGSVMVLQDAGVFRARAAERIGDEWLVTPAPCAINDLIADGSIRFGGVRVEPRSGRPKALRPQPAPRPTTVPSMPLLDRFVPHLYAQESGTSGKLGDFDYTVNYTAADDAVAFDANAKGDVAGFRANVTANGHLAGFEVSGGADVRRGAPETLALLVKSLVGEVNFEATAARHDNAAHPGNQLVKIPHEFVWPLVIDGIPFLLKLGVALLLNEGLTNIDAQARFGVRLTFKGSAGFDMKLPGDPKQAAPKTETDLDTDFSFTHGESVGLGPQALLVAMQCPRLAFGLGLDLPFVDVFAGPYVDVVTAASHTGSGAMAIVPCQRNQLVVTGAVGCEGAFVNWQGDMRVEAYRKEIVRAVPDTKACRLE